MVRKIQDWFHSESCLPFARITSLYLKAAESKMGFEQMVHKFPLGTFRPENRTALSDVPFAFQPDFPETFLLMVNNLKITFMEDDKRQFLQCDQFFPLHVVYCLFFIHFTVYYNWAKNFICFNGEFRYDIGIQWRPCYHKLFSMN